MYVVGKNVPFIYGEKHVSRWSLHIYFGIVSRYMFFSLILPKILIYSIRSLECVYYSATTSIVLITV